MCDIGILGRGIRIGLMVWSGCKSVVLVRGCGIGLMVRYLQEDCDVVMVMVLFFLLRSVHDQSRYRHEAMLVSYFLVSLIVSIFSSDPLGKTLQR